MTLNANALVDLAEARAVLGFGADTSQDASVESVINRASDLAENVYCLRPLKQRTFTNLRIEGTRWPKLYPEAWPIDTVGTVTVSVNGAVQSLWKSEGDGDPALMDVQVYPDHFYRAEGWLPTGRVGRNVLVTYDGGYDPVPEDLKVGVLELIAKMWGSLEQQRPDFASMAGPGGSLQTLDGQWSGQSGVPWSLSRRTKEVFESYRRVRG